MKVFLNWSGGKDASFCLHKLKEQSIPVSALVTTMNEHTNRISMHGVSRSLLEEQARCIGLPLHTVELPGEASMQIYEEAIHHQNKLLKEEGFTHVASGDLFLEDLKTYREKLYAQDGIECLFPIWEKDTSKMLRQFIDLGFKALIVCVNASMLDKSFCGRMIDESFIRDLPKDVDRCGENGEYHSFVFDGPVFHQPVPFEKGELVYREYAVPSNNNEKETKATAGFYFCDLLPC